VNAHEQIVNVGALAGALALVHQAWERGTAGAFRIPTRFITARLEKGVAPRPRPP